ncbi:hypothetical protein PLEOSDRAFT_1090809 [Pleurotus ostreatus PC15]|uniref:Uncharacterized protein n=1 Tax=Pleurotus ostreatus (strain PC15) TaxID=1137138 RepID=A0A067NHW5_PLEO1|nr:hypothetical protein PLEOSDRAFT_1090809 [Pleurotus ostreatus PC15]
MAPLRVSVAPACVLSGFACKLVSDVMKRFGRKFVYLLVPHPRPFINIPHPLHPLPNYTSHSTAPRRPSRQHI